MLRSLKLDPHYQTIIHKLRTLAPSIQASNYDISERCNLKCEGCLYYEGEAELLDESASAENWQELFIAERERGINYPYFGGAEPTLEMDVLRAAAEVWSQGVVLTNGTVKVPDDLPFMIHVGFWSLDAEYEKHLRGASVFEKALKNYENDPRVVYIYTISRENVKDVRKVAEFAAEKGIKVILNLYSPTKQYNSKLDASAGDSTAIPVELQSETFRFSTEEDNLTLRSSELAILREELPKLAAEYDANIMGTPHYYKWVCREAPVYTLDENGIATDCAVLNTESHRHYLSDLSYTQPDCCSPHIDCSTCRLSAHSMTNYLSNKGMLRDKKLAAHWLDLFNEWGRMSLLAWEAVPDDELKAKCS